MMIRAEKLADVQSELINLADAKTHLRVLANDEDALIGALITAAREEAEAVCGRRFGEQTWRLSFDGFDRVRLAGCGQVTSATVQARQPDGSWAAVASGFEVVKSVPAVVRFLDAFARPEPVEFEEKLRVETVCGEPLPKTVRAWMLLRVGTLYENREADSTNKTAPHDFVSSLLAPHRVLEF